MDQEKLLPLLPAMDLDGEKSEGLNDSSRKSAGKQNVRANEVPSRETGCKPVVSRPSRKRCNSLGTDSCIKGNSLRRSKKRCQSVEMDSCTEDTLQDDDFCDTQSLPDKVHECAICGASFPRPWRLHAHMKTHTGQGSFKCDFDGCTKTYSYSHHLERHKSTSHSDLVVTSRILCPAPGCGMLLSSACSLSKHLKRYHDDSAFPFPCPDCDKKFRKHRQLRLHLIEHTGVAPLKCHVCGMGFTLQGPLNRHMRGHKEYSCDIPGCEQKFTNFSSFNKHKAEHNTCFTTLLCAHCNKEFKSKGTLRDHVRKHLEGTDHPTFRCPYESCPRIYYQKRNLTQHINLRHEKKSSFQCDWKDCDRVFQTKRKLEYHKNVHINGKAPSRSRTTPRARRKDAGTVKKAMAAKLSGLLVPYAVEKQLLEQEASKENSEQSDQSQTESKECDPSLEVVCDKEHLHEEVTKMVVNEQNESSVNLESVKNACSEKALDSEALGKTENERAVNCQDEWSDSHEAITPECSEKALSSQELANPKDAVIVSVPAIDSTAIAVNKESEQEISVSRKISANSAEDIPVEITAQTEVITESTAPAQSVTLNTFPGSVEDVGQADKGTGPCLDADGLTTHTPCTGGNIQALLVVPSSMCLPNSPDSGFADINSDTVLELVDDLVPAIPKPEKIKQVNIGAKVVPASSSTTQKSVSEKNKEIMKNSTISHLVRIFQCISSQNIATKKNRATVKLNGNKDSRRLLVCGPVDCKDKNCVMEGENLQGPNKGISGEQEESDSADESTGDSRDENSDSDRDDELFDGGNIEQGHGEGGDDGGDEDGDDDEGEAEADEDENNDDGDDDDDDDEDDNNDDDNNGAPGQNDGNDDNNNSNNDNCDSSNDGYSTGTDPDSDSDSDSFGDSSHMGVDRAMAPDPEFCVGSVAGEGEHVDNTSNTDLKCDKMSFESRNESDCVLKEYKSSKKRNLSLSKVEEEVKLPDNVKPVQAKQSKKSCVLKNERTLSTVKESPANAVASQKLKKTKLKDSVTQVCAKKKDTKNTRKQTVERPSIAEGGASQKAPAKRQKKGPINSVGDSDEDSDIIPPKKRVCHNAISESSDSDFEPKKKNVLPLNNRETDHVVSGCPKENGHPRKACSLLSEDIWLSLLRKTKDLWTLKPIAQRNKRHIKKEAKTSTHSDL